MPRLRRVHPRELARSAAQHFAERVDKAARASGGADRGTQIALGITYGHTHSAGGALPDFADIEFRNNSQNGEDGILLRVIVCEYNNVLPEPLPEIPPSACLESVWARTMQRKWWSKLKDRAWVRT